MPSVTRRRSRWHREPDGRQVGLTERDLAVLQLLYRYRYLRSTFLHAFVGGPRTPFIKRLGHLYHNGGYISRPEQQRQFANCRYMPAIYELSPAGERLLYDRNAEKADDSPLLKKGRLGAYRNFAHAVMVADILASIELGIRRDPSLKFITWREILDHPSCPPSTRRSENPFRLPATISYTAPRTAKTIRTDTFVVPDGLFGIRYARAGKEWFRFFALEADRDSMPVWRGDLQQTSYLKKILAYRHVVSQGIYRSHLGLPNFTVLNVTVSQTHMRNIIDLVQELTGGSKLFLFQTISTLGDFARAPAPSPFILTAPWHRAGYPDTLVNQVED